MTEIVLPAGWPRPNGYSNGVVAAGRWLAVAGQIGWDPATQRLVSSEMAAQAERALRNVTAVLAAAGGRSEHLVRMTWYVTSRSAYERARREIGAAYAQIVGAHYPAMTLVEVAGLLQPGALVEIEATAVLPA